MIGAEVRSPSSSPGEVLATTGLDSLCITVENVLEPTEIQHQHLL